MKMTNTSKLALVMLNILLVVGVIYSVWNIVNRRHIIELLSNRLDTQYYYSERNGFGFKAPLKYSISESTVGIDIDRKDNEIYLSMRFTESYKKDTRSVLENLEFYSGNAVDVTVDTYHGFDRYQYQSGPRKGDLYYLKPLDDYFFAGIYGTDPSYKDDMDSIVASFEYYPHEK